jgi:NADH-quinone oxidoreductase subunit J
MSAERLLFALFALGSVVSAITVIAVRDPVRAALALITCFFSIACLYLLQSAELLAVLEILVYAGAIMVLFVFVIMLVENRDEAMVPPGLLQRAMLPIKLAGALAVLALLGSVVRRTMYEPGQPLPAGFGSARLIGKEFFNSFGFQFELTSVLLLVAIVGAVMISRRDPHDEVEKR